MSHEADHDGENEQNGQRVALIVTGGSPLLASALHGLPPHAFVIAADSGLDHALRAGLQPDLVVGDLDSVSASGLSWARDHDVPIEVHPTDKDATDTQLALSAACARGLDTIVVLSGGGDRLDHTISAITALGHSSLADCRIEARWGTARIHVLHSPTYAEIGMAPGTTFSLLALHGPCTRVSLRGARWPLEDAIVEPGTSLGVSNVATGDAIQVSIGGGVLTVLIPLHDGTQT